MGLGGNEPIRQREFDLYRDGVDHRLRQLERFRERHQKDHDEDDDDEADRRRWTWQQVAAWVGAAAVLASAWITAAAAR